MGGGDPARRAAFHADEAQFLIAAVRALQAYAERVVDAAVRELFIQKVVLVLDYASFRAVSAQAPPAAGTTSLFGGGFGAQPAQQVASINVRTLVVPAWCVLLELFNALAAPEELLEALCKVCARVKLTDPESFFGALGDYAQVFDKFITLIVVNKQSAGALLNLFKGDPRLLLPPGAVPGKAAARFYGYLRQTLLYDLRAIDALYANRNYFYIQKLYDFLTFYIERDNSNAVLYHVINSQDPTQGAQPLAPEQLNYLQLKAFMANLGTLDSPLTQKAVLQYLCAHLSREATVSGVEAEVHGRLYGAGGRGLAELLVQLAGAAVPAFFSWAATLATRRAAAGSGADLVLLVTSTARQLK